MRTRKILVFTDAWDPQVNGVVNTLKETASVASKTFDAEMIFITPLDFGFKFPCPTYPEIKLVFPTKKQLSKIFLDTNPSHIHIATEGPIGQSAAKFCYDMGLRYTTSYHTNFDQYRSFLPKKLVRWYLNRVHKNSSCIMVSTKSMQSRLQTLYGYDKNKIKLWGRGVDSDLFFYDENQKSTDPYVKQLLYVGRVSSEKNIEDFLNLPDSDNLFEYVKTVVGDGPQRKELEKKYTSPNIKFLGVLKGKELADAYRSADVFVFPSTSDTFGMVQVEAMACGTPVAAYPCMGPIDVIVPGLTGYMNTDLSYAVTSAMNVDRSNCAKYARKQYKWERTTGEFLDNLVKC